LPTETGKLKFANRNWKVGIYQQKLEKIEFANRNWKIGILQQKLEK
jgi:hypothetical protein